MINPIRVLLCISLFVLPLISCEEGKQQLKSIGQLTESNNEFGIRLLHRMERDEGQRNVLISPVSIGTALTMAMAGAKGNTYRQMFDSLGFPNNHSLNDIILGYKQLYHHLNQNKSPDKANYNTRYYRNSSFYLREQYQELFQSAGYSRKETKNILYNEEELQNRQLIDEMQNRLDYYRNRPIFSVCMVIAVAVPENDKILPSYLHILETKFYSKNILLDESEINKWVNKRTNGKIKKIIDNIQDDAVMLLLNAVHFRGIWVNQFTRTQNDLFYLDQNRSKMVPFMSQGEEFYRYANFDDGQLFELQYRDCSFSMLIFLPHRNQTASLTASFLNHSLSSRVKQLHRTLLNVEIPKFRFDASYSLRKPLIDLGFDDAFSIGQADFSNMTQTPLHISNVIHKTQIEVNEEGTDAAASTSVEMILSGSVEQPIEIKVDRPFMYFIRDEQTNAVLFVGVMRDP